MMSLGFDDWYRALLCILFIEGAIYFIRPQIIQNFASRVLVDAPVGSLRLFGALMIVVGFILWSVYRP